MEQHYQQQQRRQQQHQQQHVKPLFSSTSTSKTTALASSPAQSRPRSRSHSDSITVDITAAIPATTTTNANNLILDTTVTPANDGILPLKPLSSSSSKPSSLTHSSSSSSSTSPTTTTTNVTPSTSSHSARPRLGYFFMLLSAICHALVAFFVHLGTSIDGLSPISALFIRSLTSLVLSLLYFAVPFTPSLRTVFQPLLHSHAYVPAAADDEAQEEEEEEEQQRSRRRLTRLLVMRGLVGSVTSGTAFAALAYLPVGTAVTLFYLSPALTSLVAHVYLGEPLTRRLIGVIILNFIGIALVSNNSSSSSGTNNTSMSMNMNNTGQGVIFAVVSACAASLVYTTQRAMGSRLHFVLGVLSFGVACLLLVMLIMLFLIILRPFATPLFPQSLWSFSLSRDLVSHARGVGMAIVSGLAGFGSQSFLNLGLAHTPPAPAVVVRSLNVPMSYAAGFVALGERPNAAGSVGVACVVASVVAIAVEKMSVAVAAATETARDRTRATSSGTTIAAAAKKHEDGQEQGQGQGRGETQGSG